MKKKRKKQSFVRDKYIKQIRKKHGVERKESVWWRNMAKRYRWNNGNPPTHFPSGKKIPKKLRDKLRKEYKRIHEQGIISRFDLDKDGVPNKIDCNPYDPNKDFFGGMPSEHPTLLRGYNV